jgi:hypothetical protein
MGVHRGDEGDWSLPFGFVGQNVIVKKNFPELVCCFLAFFPRSRFLV